MHIRGMSFLSYFLFHYYLRKIVNIKIYVNICENNFSLSHETKTRDTRTALDYVQIQRMCLNLNVDTYAVFSFFKKFRILNGLIVTSLLTLQKAQIQRKENADLSPVLILMLGDFCHIPFHWNSICFICKWLQAGKLVFFFISLFFFLN